jgi:hypothetical protein
MNTSIKQTLLGFFQESDGTGSSMRFIFIIGCFWAMAIITYLAIHQFDKIGFVGLIAMFTSIFGTLGGLKIGQKYGENKPATQLDSATVIVPPIPPVIPTDSTITPITPQP